MTDQSAPRQAAGAARAPFRRMRRPEERVRLLGAVMDLVKPAEVFHFAAARIAQRRKTIVANHNLHSLYLLRRDAEVRAFYDRADLVEVDSVPLIAWARLIGRPGRRFHRCTYLDWRDDFWTWVARDDLRVFFVGGAPGVAERAIERIQADHPGVAVAAHHGYFDLDPASDSAQAVVAAVGAFAPDILLVGMGMPRQEIWLHRNYDALPACVMFPVGGAFDYEAGVQRPAPRWLGQIGAEWLFRLVTNRRLAARYLIEPWWLVGPALRDVCTAAFGISERDSPQSTSAISRSR
jgi:N-acetylglucosaminyldiphosphoundecaprenol N-acetyl-beta-D-mannosaminyltransferase